MILDQIVADKRLEIEKRQARISTTEFRARAESAPEPLDFAAALRGKYIALIAEIKPASPSRGEIRAGVDPLQIARVYEANGARAISVLTDQKYFRGDPNNLKSARVGSRLPLLRKDFILDEYQVFESRALQADAILLIVRILEDGVLKALRELAESLGMAALVEVHDEHELERALRSGARVLGVNNRNLSDFTVDLAVTERLAPHVPPDVILVSESGVWTRADVEQVAKAGTHAVLVGEALMRAQDMPALVRELSSVPLPSTVAGRS